MKKQMTTVLRKLLSRQKSVENNSFVQIMSMANMIEDSNPEGLLLLVRALLRPLQSEHMVAIAERSDHEAPPSLGGQSFFFDLNTVSTNLEFYQRHKPVVRVDLSKDIVLPTPWKRRGYENTLANIGSGKVMGDWRQDSNHCVAVWWPWRIAFVNGGNHSITAGILSGEGVLTATDVYDLTPIFDRVNCDGRVYREFGTGRILGLVNDTRRAAVFEIGRLMVKAGLPQG